jgi:hypothetical protein
MRSRICYLHSEIESQSYFATSCNNRTIWNILQLGHIRDDLATLQIPYDETRVVSESVRLAFSDEHNIDEDIPNVSDSINSLEMIHYRFPYRLLHQTNSSLRQLNVQ